MQTTGTAIKLEHLVSLIIQWLKPLFYKDCVSKMYRYARLKPRSRFHPTARSRRLSASFFVGFVF